eukprot:scaffold1170_cov158-Ochromonas_danica.AAC.16
MGGGRRYEYPKWVWSPSGGWWADPVHWKRNTIFCGVVIAATAFAVYQYSESKTVSVIIYYPTTTSPIISVFISNFMACVCVSLYLMSRGPSTPSTWRVQRVMVTVMARVIIRLYYT